MAIIKQFFRWLFEILFRDILNSPLSKQHLFARSVFVGLFVCFTPTVGLQQAIIVVLFGILNFTPFRINLPVAWAWSWFSNPLTMGPMYYGYYWLGSKILPVQEGHVWSNISFSDVGFSEAWEALAPILTQFLLGSFLISLTTAVTGYIVTVSLINIFNRRNRNI